MIASVQIAKARLSELIERAAALLHGRSKIGPRVEVLIREERAARDRRRNRVYLDTAILVKLVVRGGDGA